MERALGSAAWQGFGAWQSLAALLVCALALVFSERLAFGDTANAGPVGQPTQHGWAVLRTPNDEESMLLHLPPRTKGESSLGVLHVAPGVLSRVERVSAWGNQVCFVLESERGEEALTGRRIPIRRVMELRAMPSVLGTWVYPPGRPEVLASLPGDPVLEGFVTSDAGVFAMTRPRLRGMGNDPEFSGAGTLVDPRSCELLALFGSTWQRVTLPWHRPDSIEPSLDGESLRARVWLVAMRGGVQVVVQTHAPDREGGAGGMGWAEQWQGRPGRASDTLVGPPEAIVWERRTLPLVGENWVGQRPPVIDTILLRPGVLASDDGLLATAWSAGTLKLWNLFPSGPIALASIDGVPQLHGLCVMGGSAFKAGSAPAQQEATASPTLAIVWRAQTKGDTESSESFGTAGLAPPSGRLMVREVSLASGRTMFNAPARQAGPGSFQQYQTLAIMLVGLMACVLVLVLRGDVRATMALPTGVALGDPLRRVLAAGLDYVLAGVLAALILKAPFAQAFSPAKMMAEGSASVALLALAIAAIHCTLGEWLAGRSLGKVMLGLTVVSVTNAAGADGEPFSRVQFWQAAVRNIARWSLPLVGMFMLLDAMHRHPGDQAARTLVIAPAEPEDDEEA